MEQAEKPRHQAHAEQAAARAAAVAKARERRNVLDARAKRAIDECLKTEHGRELVMWLFELCGYNRSSVAADRLTGDVQEGATGHNEAMRLVYVKLRRLATPELLAPAELEAEKRSRTDVANQEG